VERKFFYTKDYPHQWTSGRDYYFRDYENEPWGMPLESLDDAKRCAEQGRVKATNKRRCDTTYGEMIEYKVED
jgi:hypothetical protein